MKETYHNDLEVFRQVAVQADTEEKAKQLLKLLAWLGKTASMQLAVQYFEWYLPRFKELYPAENWVEKRFEEVKNAVLLDNLDTNWPLIFPEYYNKNSDVDMRNIQYGIMYNMWSMIKSINDSKLCIEYTGNVLLCTLMMVRKEYDVRVPPEFLKEGEVPDLKNFVANLWLGLADKIETLLILKYSSDEMSGN